MSRMHVASLVTTWRLYVETVTAGLAAAERVRVRGGGAPWPVMSSPTPNARILVYCCPPFVPPQTHDHDSHSAPLFLSPVILQSTCEKCQSVAEHSDLSASVSPPSPTTASQAHGEDPLCGSRRPKGSRRCCSTQGTQPHLGTHCTSNRLFRIVASRPAFALSIR